MEHEYKWWLDVTDVENDPFSYVLADVFERHLDSFTNPVTVTQSTLYVDDARHSLTRNGHSLGLVLNTGAIAHVAWLGMKQTIRWEGRRDCLEIAERVDPAQAGRIVNDRSLPPVAHLYRYGMVADRLAPVGVLTQVRHKRLGASRELGCWFAYGVDVVELRAPGPDARPVGRYACMEIESNDSSPGALRVLAELASGLGRLLGRPVETRTKCQIAVQAAARAAVPR